MDGPEIDQPAIGRIAARAALLARIGTDPQDDEDMRHKKALLVLLGILGEVLFPDADVPVWFTTTMLALNVVGTGSIAFTLLASFAKQRNAALTALRAEQEKSEALLMNVLPSSIAERLKTATG